MVLLLFLIVIFSIAIPDYFIDAGFIKGMPTSPLLVISTIVNAIINHVNCNNIESYINTIMIKGHDFIFTGLQPWDLSMGSNARDIALEVSKNNRVLYVNSPLSKLSSDLKSDNIDVLQRQKVLRKEASPLRSINENLWLLDFPFTLLPVNSLPDGAIFDFVNHLNNKRLFNYINKTLTELNFKDTIHFCDNDIYRSFYAKNLINAKMSIYYRRDNLLGIEFWKRHALRLEPLLIAKSDLAVCNSAELANFAKRYNKKSFDIGQGVDLSAYKISNENKPSDISQIPHPIIGYMGHITSLRLDADLIYNLAKDNPACSFVLVGRIDEVFAKHPMNDLKNVYFLGSKSPDTVPAYINAFDICINPQALNEITIGNYPRKIDEYLSLGKPTIATKTDTMMMFEPYVYLCKTKSEYQDAINQILSGSTKQPIEALVAYANNHTWENSVGSLYNIINQYEKKRY